MNALIADKKKWLRTNLKGLGVKYYETKGKTMYMFDQNRQQVAEFNHDFISLYVLAMMDMGMTRILPNGSTQTNTPDILT